MNLLVLAAVTPRLRVPLLWTVIGHRGSSDTGQRIALMRRYLAIFELSSIRLLLADREFVGSSSGRSGSNSSTTPTYPSLSGCAATSVSSARRGTS